MMDFLLRLAPPLRTDASRAVAALPSRFAVGGPLRAAMTEPSPVQRTGDEASSMLLDAAPESSEERGPAQSSSSVRSTRPAAPSPVAAEDRHIEEVSRSHASPRVPSEPSLRREQLDNPAPSHSPAACTASGIDAPIPPRAVRHRPQQAERAASTLPFAPDARASPATIANADHPRAAAAATGAVRAGSPLSEASLAQRALPARDHRPVIHVTIDRIDVLAPAAAPRAAPARKARAATPTVSLGDYLRARACKPGGAS